MKYIEKEDICAHHGEDYQSHNGAIVPPIYQNSLFVQPDGLLGSGDFIYTRVSNPTIEVAEAKIAALQGGEAAKCFGSGMAAITAGIMHFIEKDCHIITIANVYGPTRRFFDTYLKKFGVEVTFIAGEKIEEFEQAIRPNTKLIYLESPSSFVFRVQDLEAVARFAKEKGIKTMIDNTWATPVYQNPLAYGIDLVVHTASKYLGGHSDIVAGVLIGNKDLMDAIQGEERELFGGIMDPHQSWLLTRGLRTLMVRLKEHGHNGLMVARYLEGHSKVKRVYYPGLKSHPQYDLCQKQMTGGNGLLSFELDAGDDEIVDFIKNLKYFQLGPSWGGFESLIVAPSLGKSDEELEALMLPKGLVRIHVGLENVSSLINDLAGALEKIS
jgi:cystathionine beta-lyase